MTEPDKVIPGEDHPWTMRLQRYLARAGVASRRGSEDLITAGRVSVNGSVVTELGTKVTLGVDEVTVDGHAIAMGEGPVYLMLHKPAGYLTTMADPQGRPCVAELVPRERFPGLFPVGRLDKDTTGLLLFTTDGDTGNRLLHPSFHVPKRYLALVDGRLADEELGPLRQGITLDDGPCRPAPCTIIDRAFARELWPDDAQTIENGTVTPVSIELREGRKNQVKRMFDAIHHPVIRLHRDRMGPLTLGELPEGAWRELEETEVTALKSDMQRMAIENDPTRTREDEI